MQKAKEELGTEVKEAATEVASEFRPAVLWVSLRETICAEGFDNKRGWRRIAALLGATNAPFCR